MRHHPLGQCAAADDSHDAVAGLPGRDHVRPEGVDLARELQPGNRGRHARRRRILALRLKKIRVIQARGANPDPDELAARLRRGHLADQECFGTSGSGQEHGTHVRG